MSSQRERLRPQPVALSPLTVVAGVVHLNQGPRPYTMTDTDRDRFLAASEAAQKGKGITRPSGEPGAPKRSPERPGEAAGWSPRQQAVAREIQRLWYTAKPLRGLPRGYPIPKAYTGGMSMGMDLTPEQAEIAQSAWDRYCTAMDDVVRRCSQRHADALRMVVVYGEPSTLARAYLVREALTFLGDLWKYR